MSRRRRRPNRTEIERLITKPVATLPRDGQAQRDPVYARRRPQKPTLLTEEVEQRFLIAIRSGNYPDVAAQLCGLNPRTVREWIARGRGRLKGRAPTPEYIRFARLVEEAEAHAEALVTGNLVNLSRTKTTAALAWLRTRAPRRWPTDPGGLPEMPPGHVPPPTPPVIGEVERVDRIERDRVVIVPLEAFPEITRQLLEQKRETHRVALAANSEEPYAEPEIDHDSTLRSAGLRTDA